MGKVNIIIECEHLSTEVIVQICHRNLGALTTALELNADDADLVDIFVVPSDED